MNDIEICIYEMRRDESDIIDIIKAVSKKFGLSISDAKSAVHNSPAWKSERDDFDKFHDAIISNLDDSDV